MARNISDNMRNELLQEGGNVFPLYFVTLTHPTMPTPVHIVNDMPELSYILDGVTYTALPFQVQPMSDTDTPATAPLAIQNVDRVIGAWLLGFDTPLQASIKVILSDQFDLTQNPRLPIGTPFVEYTLPYAELTNVTLDAVSISGDLNIWDFRQERYPQFFSSQSKTPGLFL